MENALIRKVYNLRRVQSQEAGNTYLRFSQHSSTLANNSGASMISARSTSSLISDYSLVAFLKEIGCGYVTCSLCLYETTGKTDPPSKRELAEVLKAAFGKGDFFVYGYKRGVNRKLYRNLKTIRDEEIDEGGNTESYRSLGARMRKFLPKTNSPIFLRVAPESNLNAGKQNRVSLALDDLSHIAPD